MSTDLFTRLQRIHPSMGREAMCNEIVEVGKGLEAAQPSFGRMTLMTLRQDILSLRTTLLEAFPLREDPVPYLTLVSMLPLDVNAAHQLTYDLSNLSNYPNQEQVLFQLSRALVDNIKRNHTLERESEFFKKTEPPRTAGEGVWAVSDFEKDFESMAYNLLDSQAQDQHCCLDLIEHVFSFSINCQYLNLQAPLLKAMLAMGINRVLDEPAEGWPAMKQWLDVNEDRVCVSLLEQGWNREFKPALVKDAQALGYTQLANAIVLRSCRHEKDAFLALKRDFNVDPDQGCYDVILKNHRGEFCGAESNSLTALLAHTLTYDHQMPDDWMVMSEASPLKLLDSAYQEVKKNGFMPLEDKLQELFEKSLRKLRNDRDLKWLESSIFAPFLRQSLAYQGERFGQDLGL